jgi:hypothetical protein
MFFLIESLPHENFTKVVLTLYFRQYGVQWRSCNNNYGLAMQHKKSYFLERKAILGRSRKITKDEQNLGRAMVQVGFNVAPP